MDSSKTAVTLDTYGIQQSKTIPLYTLSRGSHTLVVESTDLAGNTSSQTIQFQTTASIASMKALVTHFANKDLIDNEYIWIDNMGIAKSLQSKLDANDLASLIDEVTALRGKHISEQAADYLLRDVDYLLNNQ